MPTKPKELPSRTYRASEAYLVQAKAIGARIRAVRKSRGWTLEEAAKHTGLRYQHIQQIETGTLNVTLITLIRIAEGLGVDLGRFFVDAEPRELGQ